MKLTFLQIGNLNDVFSQLTSLALPPKKAYALYRISKVITEKFDFIVEQQKKMVEKHNATIGVNGQVSFQNGEDMKAFQAELQELNAIEEELDIEPIILTEKEARNIALTMAQAAALEGIIVFE